MSRLVAALALVLIASASHAAPKTPYDRAMTPYIAELNRQCPGRKLEDLSAGGLELIMEGFVERLTPAQRRQVQDTVGERCARIEAGLTCANTASLDAFRRLGVLRRFVDEACATTWTCRAFADCTQTQP
jgi:hypothetical protein